MNKKQIRTLCVLAAIAVLLGAALAVLRYEKAPQVLPALVEIPKEEIDQLVFSSQNSNINLQLQDGAWQLLLPDITLPANQDMVNTLLTQLCAIRPQQQLEETHLEQISSAVRQASLQILSGAGTEQVEASQEIIIGSMNAITEQLYVQTGDNLYLTATELLKIFPTELELLEQFQIPKPDDHRTVTVENALGAVVLSCVSSQTGGEDGTWYVKTGDAWTQADQDQAYNFYFLTWDMHWKSTAGYITDQSQLADYGLDKPQARYTLTYGSETFDLIFGTNLPDNTTYAMCAGSPLVYTMDTLLAQWLAQATADAVLPANS